MTSAATFVPLPACAAELIVDGASQAPKAFTLLERSEILIEELAASHTTSATAREVYDEICAVRAILHRALWLRIDLSALQIDDIHHRLDTALRVLGIAL